MNINILHNESIVAMLNIRSGWVNQNNPVYKLGNNGVIAINPLSELATFNGELNIVLGDETTMMKFIIMTVVKII